MFGAAEVKLQKSWDTWCPRYHLCFFLAPPDCRPERFAPSAPSRYATGGEGIFFWGGKEKAGAAA